MEDSFQHFQYSDIDIVQVNLTKATLEVASIFNKFLDKIINKERNKIVINLSNCEFIDPSIFGVLVSDIKKVRTTGGDLIIVRNNESEYSMFTLAKMDNIFKIFHNLKEAINSFSL